MDNIKEIKLQLPQWRIEEETGYKPITTFYQDFSIADIYGIDAIKDTYKIASVYNDLWIELDNWCKNNFNDNELKYYYSTTD